MKVASACALVLLSIAPSLARADPTGDAPGAQASDASSGRPVVLGPGRPEPSSASLRACSFRLPVCASGRPGDEPRLRAILAQAEVSFALLRGPLRLPWPDRSLATGTFDLFLVDEPGEGSTVLDARDPRSPLDRASGHVRLPRALGLGCALDSAVTRQVLRAALLRAAPGTDEGSAEAETEALLELMVPCAPARSAAAHSTFQAHPERALVDRIADRAGRFTRQEEPPFDDEPTRIYSRGAALFYRWLDRSYGTEPGAVLRGLWALRATKTPGDSPRWVNEPDAFEVLSRSFRDTLFEGSKFEDLLLDFAGSRARFGAPSEGGALAVMGQIPKTRIEWEIPWPSSPRRLAPAWPLSPTGAGYMVVRTAGAPAGARLRLEAEWEEHARMRLMFLRLDASGRELARVRIPARETATSAQISVVDLAGVDRVVFVALNTGDPAFQFDPDDVAFEPHGFMLTVGAE